MRTSLRSLLHTPAFTSVAVLTLAVGIAANAALFSVYDVSCNPVRVPDPASLVAIWSNNPQLNFNAPAVSWSRYVELQRGARSFSSIAVSAFDNFTLTGQDQQPDQLNGLRVSGAFFRDARHRAGARARVPDGRGRPERTGGLRDQRRTVDVTLRPTRVTRGRVIQLNGQPWEVVGIMPPQLTAPFRQVQVFAPRVFEIGGLTPQQIEAGAGYSQPIARLRRACRSSRPGSSWRA